MQQLRLRIRMLARRPTDDEPEGEHLVALVLDALRKGGAGAVAVVVRAERTELVELRGVVEAGVPVQLFLAGLTRSSPEGFGPPCAIGLAGRFIVRPGRPGGGEPGLSGGPVALAFLEWPDCRWWQWRVVLDAQGRALPDTETRRRAVDGDGLTGGLGRWWSLGRRTGNTVQFGPVDNSSAQASSLVH